MRTTISRMIIALALGSLLAGCSPGELSGGSLPEINDRIEELAKHLRSDPSLCPQYLELCEMVVDLCTGAGEALDSEEQATCGAITAKCTTNLGAYCPDLPWNPQLPADSGAPSAADAGPGPTPDAEAPSSTTTVTLQAVADTFVDEGSPSETGGSSELLYVDLNPEQRAYIAFEVPGGTIVGAELRLYIENPSAHGPKIYPATNAWLESSLTWSTQPPLPSSALVEMGAVSTGWVEVDLTGAVKAGARNSLVLVPTSTDGMDLRSRESSRPPKLILTYSDMVQPAPDGGQAPAPDAGAPQPDTGVAPTPDAASPQPDAIQATKANTFACLDTASSVQVVSGFHHEKFRPSISKDKAFDARTAEFLIEDTRYGMIDLIGDSSETGVCWAGGYAYTKLPWDASWYDHYADSSYPSKYGTWDDSMKNHVGIDARLYEGTVTGLHVYNMHDGYRFNSAEVSFVLQHSWAEYIRDDCIENVGRESGLIYDNYFDGCYSGISVRTNSSSVYSGRVVQMKKNLIYMEPQPWPYKYDEKSFYFTHQGITYGSGNLFKMDPDPEQNPQFVLEDNVFLFTYESASSSTDLPDEQFLKACSNNTIIWLGSGNFPGSLPSTSKFPNCYTILTGAAGKAFWKAKVQDWFARHPDVDPARHPPVSQQGDISFPRVF